MINKATAVDQGHFGWLSIIRLGLVQACLGSIVVITTSTLNRIMVVEHALPALLPGFLVALHYLVQVVRPRMGFGSDMGGRRTSWIVGGMVLLAFSGVLASVATVLMSSQLSVGIALAVLAFIGIGVGVSASGTSLLVLLAKRVQEQYRAPAATIVWMMMIVGFAVTAGTAGHLLDPYSPERLIQISVAIAVIAVIVTIFAVWGLEGTVKTKSLASFTAEVLAQPSAQPPTQPAAKSPVPAPSFKEALSQVWAEPVARQFTIFVFIAMLAYSSQDLILEPFAGTVFEFTPGQSTKLSGLQHGGVLAGMILVALAGGAFRGKRFGTLKTWTIGGCIASAIALLGLVIAGLIGPVWPIKSTVFLLGVANGAFSIAAIGSMMRLASEGREEREGTRMGLWGAAQALAFGAGGLVGTGASDLARWAIGNSGVAYAAVFAFEALLFLLAAWLAYRLADRPTVDSKNNELVLA
jgi:MFS transporter, BCD family, chlorophyll transporter